MMVSPVARGTYEQRTWQSDPGADHIPRRHRKACRYETFTPTPLTDIVSLDVRTAGLLDDAATAVAALNAERTPALEPFARLLLRSEAIASSRIEQINLDERAYARAELNWRSGRRTGPEAQEIRANIDAMIEAVEVAAAGDIGVDSIRAVHRALMAGDPRSSNQREAGRIRTEQNWIGGNHYNPCGAVFVPPPPDRVHDLLVDLCGFMTRDEPPPIAQAALAHAQFETIHPFGDGNGRTGRALVHAILRRRGLAPRYVPPISVVLSADRQAYINGLTLFRDGQVDHWLQVFADATERSAGLADAYLQRVRQLQSTWRTQLKKSANPRADAVAWLLIEELPAMPVVDVDLAVAATGRSKAVVGIGINQLTEAGILVPIDNARRGRRWEPEGLLELLENLQQG